MNSVARDPATLHDVAIIGGGMVGCALACGLGEAGLRVAIVEERPWDRGPFPTSGYDLRVSAMTRASERIFQAFHAWEHMALDRLGPFREMRVWDATGSGAIHFDSAEIGEPTLGYVAENRVIQRALEARLAELETVAWFRPAPLRYVRVEDERVRLELEAGVLETRLVVGADGYDSRVRHYLGMPSSARAYGQQAVVATVRTEEGHQETAWQRFLPRGPLAFLPLPDGFCSIVWSTPSQRAAMLVAMETTQFERELQRAFGSRLGAVTVEGPRAAFPLRSLHAEQYVQPRVALVGDAAHTIHPLAGQGVNLGLLDAATLVEVVRDAYQAGRDVGGYGLLRRYERWRKGHNLLMLSVMDGFRWLFGSPSPAIRLARNLGLNVTDQLDPVKHLIMRYATGLAGDLPRAARDYRASVSSQG